MLNSVLSPIQIEVLLRIYYCHSVADPTSKAQRQAAGELHTLDLAEPAGGPDFSFNLTPRGRAHVRQLLELPLPVQAWVTPAGAILDIGDI